VIFNLRQYDGVKAHSAMSRSTSAAPGPGPGGKDPFAQELFQHMTPHMSGVHHLEESGGFLSTQAKVYLSDVHDHLQELESTTESVEFSCQNLISYTFNSTFASCLFFSKLIASRSGQLPDARVDERAKLDHRYDFSPLPDLA
jgi:hypothetical protein